MISGVSVNSPSPAPRTFASPAEAIRDFLDVVRRARPLSSVYLRHTLDPQLRERVMFAVSHVNSCGGCTFVHERLASRAGVSSEDLEAIGLGDLGELDDRSRAAVVYATALAETRFRGPIPADLTASVADQLSPDELAAVDAVARGMAFANLSSNTAEELIGRLRYGQQARAEGGEVGHVSA